MEEQVVAEGVSYPIGLLIMLPFILVWSVLACCYVYRAYRLLTKYKQQTFPRPPSKHE